MAAMEPKKTKFTRGTPTNITLFKADSRMRAALFTDSERLRTLVLGGSVTKRYKCPTDDGMFAVSKVHVCEYGLSVNCKFGMSVFSQTVKTSQPFSAFLRLASVRVLSSIPCNLRRGGLGCEFGFRKDSRCLIAGGRCLTISTWSRCR